MSTSTSSALSFDSSAAIPQLPSTRQTRLAVALRLSSSLGVIYGWFHTCHWAFTSLFLDLIYAGGSWGWCFLVFGGLLLFGLACHAALQWIWRRHPSRVLSYLADPYQWRESVIRIHARCSRISCRSFVNASFLSGVGLVIWTVLICILFLAYVWTIRQEDPGKISSLGYRFLGWFGIPSLAFVTLCVLKRCLLASCNLSDENEPLLWFSDDNTEVPLSIGLMSPLTFGDGGSFFDEETPEDDQFRNIDNL